MNWVCNNVTTIYICYTSLTLHLYFAKLSLYWMDQSNIFPDFSQILFQIMDKNENSIIITISLSYLNIFSFL